MKTYLKYGGAAAGGAFVMVLILFAIGMHSDPSQLSTAQMIQMVLGLAIGITCTVLGIKERRAATPLDQDFGYGKALGAGVMVTLIAATLGLATNAIYMHVVNPGFNDVIVQAQIAKWEAANMSAARIEQAEAMMRKMMSPPIQMAMGFAGGMFFGTIISLIAAAFLKRPPADELEPVSN